MIDEIENMLYHLADTATHPAERKPRSFGKAPITEEILRALFKYYEIEIVSIYYNSFGEPTILITGEKEKTHSKVRKFADNYLDAFELWTTVHVNWTPSVKSYLKELHDRIRSHPDFDESILAG